jgi:hypothetical protein
MTWSRAQPLGWSGHDAELFRPPSNGKDIAVKKLIALLLMGAVLFTGAVGCGGADTGKEKEKEKEKKK